MNVQKGEYLKIQFKDTARTELPMEVLPWVHPYKRCELGSYDPNWQSYALI